MQTSVGYPEIPEAGCIVTFGLSWDQSTQRQTDIVMRDDLRGEKKKEKTKTDILEIKRNKPFSILRDVG